MRIDATAYACRWQDVAPAAKGGFALAGMVSAWLACKPGTLAILALLSMLGTLAGARVPLRTYLAVALAPLSFVLLSCLTMLVIATGDGSWRWAPELLPTVAHIALRSVAALAAVLGLVLTTPMPDLLALLRRLRTPELLLDLMALCYRMLFVLRQAWDEGSTAQAARLGHRGLRKQWRSTGLLAGQMAVQVWQRASALQMACDARACQGGLRFMPASFPRTRRQLGLSLLASALLLALSLRDRL
ncbi:cobalt/nickel transport system permease protein [Duganella sp. CF458]|uniref:cobalt ECF transporter T component CbiQ n=1 Tax=Duganella sp. CF458 TaxID=1884368 RepID=UPI0008DF5D1E|nr:cobalt ECF transporter T component CbiQ [Duganella sp. CF458]SFF60889.1 cobalt/nickel transport system permease protein [Duganella sp. CF458]